MTFTVGLGGGIGSGKTAASDRFMALGVSVIDADVASRAVVEKGRPALAKIAAYFGDDVLTQEGELDRGQLRAKIFSAPADKTWLEQLLHPLIGEEVNKGLEEASSPYAILVSPLLVESGQAERTDRVLIIDVPEDVQIARTSARDNNSAEQVQKIMAAQADRTTRLAKADDIVVNDGSLEALHEKIDALHQQYLKMASASGS